MAGCSHIPWCSSMWHREKEGQVVPGLRDWAGHTLAAQDSTGGGPRVCHGRPLPDLQSPPGVQVGRQARPGCGLAVGPRPRHCLSVQQGGVEVPSHRVCFPVSVHRPPPPFRERSARTSSPWAGGQGKRAQAVVTGPPLCFCGKWPDSLPASDRGVQPPPHPNPAQASTLTPCPVIPFSPDAALPPLITVTRNGCVPWDGGWGSSVPRAWAQPLGSAAWSFSGLPCQTAVSPLHCEPQEGGAGAGLSWSLLCPAVRACAWRVSFH